MDDIDRAQAQEEMARDIAIRAASARFCDVDCRDGWQREREAIKRNGGRA